MSTRTSFCTSLLGVLISTLVAGNAPAETLYEKLGGGAAIASAANYTVDSMGYIPETANNVDWSKNVSAISGPWLKFQLTSFLAELADGPLRYVGPTPAEVQAVVKLKPEEWQGVLNVLMRGLDQAKAPLAARFELIQALEEIYKNPSAWRPRGAAAAPATTAPQVDRLRYTCTKAALPPALAAHHVDFTFEYPSSWMLDPEEGIEGAVGFVRAQREIERDENGSFTLENIHFGPYYRSNPADTTPIEELSVQVIATIKESFSQNFPNYEVIDEGNFKVGAYSGYGYQFTALATGTPKGDIRIWGRCVLLPPGTGGATDGLAVTMLGTSLAPGLKGIADLGVKGELPIVLESLKIGR